MWSIHRKPSLKKQAIIGQLRTRIVPRSVRKYLIRVKMLFSEEAERKCVDKVQYYGVSAGLGRFAGGDLPVFKVHAHAPADDHPKRKHEEECARLFEGEKLVDVAAGEDSNDR